MSRALATRAEILKLARLLRRDPDSLDYLAEIPAVEVRVLREQVTDMLFTAHGQTLGRLAAASRLLPVGLVATIGERAFGPVLSARIAGMLDPGRAVEMATKLPPSFLADVAVDIDPRRASEVIGRIPPELTAAVTRELVRREEWVTMGRFVGIMSDEAIRAALAQMDDAALLRVAFVLEQKDQLEHLVSLLPEERLDHVVDAAVREDLWAEIVDLLSHVGEARRAELVGRAEHWDDATIQSVVLAAQNGLWTELLALAELLPLEAQQRIADAAASLAP